MKLSGKLSELVGLSQQTSFHQGDATQLPFEAHSFDAVWTQHVQMNIQDKDKFYAEIKRVLKTGGFFLYYDIFKKGPEPISYPVPWANEESISFLFPSDEMDQILQSMGFHRVNFQEQTEKGIAFFEKLIARIETEGPPQIGINLLMGKETPLKIGNLLKGLQEGKLLLESGVYKKQ